MGQSFAEKIEKEREKKETNTSSTGNKETKKRGRKKNPNSNYRRKQTVLYLSDDTLEKAKNLAALENRSLSNYIETLLFNEIRLNKELLDNLQQSKEALSDNEVE